MIDHILGRPSISWKRTQVILVIVFWFWRILHGDPNGPRLLWIRRANRRLKRFTPWQLIVSTLTGMYAIRHFDKILGLAAPEPLANLYSPSYYRATWITTGMDAGFATAMSIRPQWLRDLCSIVFSIYYIIYANEADEKLRKFRAVPTVEMLRATWEKTTHPFIRLVTHHPRISVRRKILLSRPKDSTHRRPITTWLFFAPPADQLSSATDLILDFPGGGFVSMTPEHHEERLRMWALRTGKPVLSVDYGKAPEYPYPYSIDECFDLYRVLVETTGMVIGMSGHALNIICSGDSAGAHIAVTVMFKILQTQMNLPHPVALVLNYAALDFNFTSWMTPQNLRVLHTEQSSGHLSLLPDQKDHLRHISPLSMVGDRRPRRRRSLRDTLCELATTSTTRPKFPLRTRHTTTDVRQLVHDDDHDERGAMGDSEDESFDPEREENKPLRHRIRFDPHVSQRQVVESPGQMNEQEIAAAPEATAPIGTRLTMTSRTGYFQDRIISPSMMRAMAILYIGPHRNPDFQSDYQLSPILAPDHLLAQFPPLLMTCGEKDPFVDDTLVFAGRVREAKRARRAELARTITTPGSGGALRRERERLARESEEDWVRMVIFSEWSHGYLQMPALMREARVVIDDIADWIAGAFGKHGARDQQDLAVGVGAAPSGRARRYSRPAPVEDSDALTSASATETETEPETELDMDEVLSFSPKRRSPPTSYAEMRRSSTASNGTARARRPSPPAPPPAHSSSSASASGKKGSPPRAGATATPAMNGILHTVPAPEVPPRRQSTNSPGAGTGSTCAGAPKGGQTITESELMRRRRLLDSHLIAQSQDSVNGR